MTPEQRLMGLRLAAAVGLVDGLKGKGFMTCPYLGTENLAKRLAWQLGYRFAVGKLPRTAKRAARSGKGRTETGDRGEWSDDQVLVARALDGQLPRPAIAAFFKRSPKALEHRLRREIANKQGATP